MKVNVFVLVIATLVSVGAFASSYHFDQYTDSEHWDHADAIVLVNIQSGVYHDKAGLDLVARKLEAIKGDVPTTLNIKVRFPSMSFPDVLGSTYLVFLSVQENGTYDLMRERPSVILVEQV